jgi:predicted metal-dependent hydrolase
MASEALALHETLPGEVQVGEHRLPLVIRRHRRAKRICLRYNPTDHAINLTLPRHTRISDGIDFISQKSAWLLSTLDEIPCKKQLKPGVFIVLMGDRYRLRHDATQRGAYSLADGLLTISGPREHFSRRVEDALKKIARDRISLLSLRMAARIGKRVQRISVRDTRSRWGSCSSTGNLSFSWRLIFAPRAVLEYVVAHEVAHLKHMNHSERFWNTVENICPNYHVAKEWLRIHGKELYRFNA